MWAGARLGYEFSAPYRAIGIVDEYRTLHGVAIFNNCTDYNVDLTAVGEGCWTRPILKALANYVFNTLKRERVTLITRASNVTARKLLSKHFKFETSRKGHFGNESGLQFRMCRDECPWLEKENGKLTVAA